MISEGCPSGQREQTVNLPAYAYSGSNPLPSTPAAGVAQLAERQPSKLNVAGSIPVSRSNPFVTWVGSSPSTRRLPDAGGSVSNRQDELDHKGDRDQHGACDAEPMPRDHAGNDQ